MFKEALVTFSILHGVNPDGNQLSRLRFQLEPQIAADISESWTSKLKLRGFFDPSQWPNSKYPKPVRSDEGYDGQIRQLTFEYSSLPWTLRLGTQSVVWGEALHYFSADVLHPKDYRDGVLNNLNWSRIPQTGLYSAVDIDDWSFQFVYFPFSQVNRYPKTGAEFSLGRYAPESFGITDYKSESLFKFSEPTIGFNAGWRIDEFELHAIVSMLRDPQFFLSFENQEFLRRHDRILQAGFTGSWARDVWLVRAELLWTPRRTLNSSVGGGLAAHDVGELNSILSIEWSEIDHLILSLQGFWNQRYDCRDGQILPCRTLQEGVKVLLMDLPYGFEIESTLWAEAKDPSFWWSSRFRKSINENLNAELMIEQFLGSGTGLFADWANRDQIWTRLEWTF